MTDIIIRKATDGFGWDVIQGDKMADSVTYEEMLGLVSALTMPEERRCLSWMWTEEQRQAWRERLRGMAKEEDGGIIGEADRTTRPSDCGEDAEG